MTIHQKLDYIMNNAVADKVIYLGSGTSFDLSSYEGFNGFSEERFVVEPLNTTNIENAGAYGTDTYATYLYNTLTKSYNVQTGILTAYLTIYSYVYGKSSYATKTSSRQVAVRAWLIP